MQENICQRFDFADQLMAESSIDANVAELRRQNALLQQKLAILTGGKSTLRLNNEKVESIHDVHVRERICVTRFDGSQRCSIVVGCFVC